MAWAWLSSTRPASVTSTVRRPRDLSTRRWPSSASRVVMWSETVEIEEFSCSAAAQKVPVSATARSARRCLSSTLCQLSGTSKSYVENPCCFGDSKREDSNHGIRHYGSHHPGLRHPRLDLGLRLAPRRRGPPDALVVLSTGKGSRLDRGAQAKYLRLLK